MRLTVKKKIGAGVLALFLMIVLIGVFSLVQMRRILSHLYKISNIENLERQAAFEMEINMLEVNANVISYIRDHDPQHLEKIKKDASQFKAALEAYRRHAEDQEEEDFASQLEENWNNFHNLAWKLIEIENRQTIRLESLTANFLKMDNILDDEIQASLKPGSYTDHQKIDAAMEMEININGIGKHLAKYTATGQSVHLNGIRKDQKDFLEAFKIYESLALTSGEKKSTELLRNLFYHNTRLIQEIIGSYQEEQKGIKELTDLRKTFDDILDDEVQAKAQSDLLRANLVGQETMQRTIRTVFALFLLSIGLGAGVWLYLSMMIIRPMKNLAAATKRITDGAFSTKADVRPGDEIGDFAESFNHMAAERQHAWQELSKMRDELEMKVNERTAELNENNRALQAEIIKHKQAQEKLKKSEAMFKTLAESAPVGIFLDDAYGNCTYVNPKCAELVGLPIDEILGRSWETAIHPDDRERVIREWGSTVEQGKTFCQEYRWVHNDGRIATTLGLVVPVKSSDNKVTLYIGILTDLSEHYQLQKERDNLTEQLYQSQKLESIGRLAGGVAHDFNNILSIIIGYTAIAKERLSQDKKYSECLEEVTRAANRAAALTKQLLAFSRRQVMEMKNINLNELIENTLKMLSRVIGEDIKLDFIPGQGLGTVHADTGQIEQVLMNLCVNARDAMPEGGILTIETKNTEVNSDFASSHPEMTKGDYVLLAVTDTGCGMDKETLAQIFDPFFTTKDSGRGTGLGLATVYGILKQHKAFIHCNSEPGKGASFNLYLPIVKSKAEKLEKTPVSKTPAVGGSETILLAEDEAILRGLAVQMIESAGYKVLVAANGLEAVKIFERHYSDISLLLLDIAMPELGGIEAYKRMIKIKTGVPVLFSSGYAAEGFQDELFKNKNVGLIQKPYAPDALLRRMREALDRAT